MSETQLIPNLRVLYRAGLAIALLGLLNGCAVFDPRSEPPPVGAGPPTTLEYRIETRAYQWKGADGPASAERDDLLEIRAASELVVGVRESLESTGLFAPTTSGSEAAFRAEIRVTTYESPLMNDLFFLLSAFLYPAHSDHRVEVRVRVVDIASQYSATASRAESFRGWYQLFLLPFAILQPSPLGYQVELAGHLAREATTEAFVDLRTGGTP